MKKWNDTYPETPSVFHNRVETTLAGLEEREMKKTFARTPALVLVILVVTIATAVAATEYFGGYVDWEGNYTPIDSGITATATLPPADNPDWTDYSAILTDVPTGEYWEIWDETGGTGSYGTVGEQAKNLEELASHMSAAKLDVVNAPDGFAVISLEMDYDCFFAEKELISEETLENGATLSKYRLEEMTDEDISGYHVNLSNAENKMIIVSAEAYIAEDYEEGVDYGFYVGEEDGYKVLDIPGFDRAVVITEADASREIRLQQDVNGGEVIKSYYVYTDCDIPTEELIEMLFN